MWSVERELDALAIYARLIVLAPNHRGRKLSVLTSIGSENVARSMGAKFQYSLATLASPHVQRALERAGYGCWAFSPVMAAKRLHPVS